MATSPRFGKDETCLSVTYSIPGLPSMDVVAPSMPQEEP